MTLYDPNISLTQATFKFAHTVLPLCLARAEFWIILAINVILCYGFWMESFPDVVFTKFFHIPQKLMDILTSLLVFFIVFYTNHSFVRYNYFYEQCREMLFSYQEFTSTLKCRLDSHRHRRKALEYALANAYVFFCTASYGEVRDGDWARLLKNGLLTKAEVEHVRNFSGEKGFLILQWALDIISEGLELKQSRLKRFMGNIYEIRGKQIKLRDMILNPVPFQYFHIMNFMLSVNLLLWSYSIACTRTLFGPIIFMIIELIFMGMRELSTQMADPFGDDDVDFDTGSWMHELVVNTTNLLEDKFEISVLHTLPIDPTLVHSNTMGVGAGGGGGGDGDSDEESEDDGGDEANSEPEGLPLGYDKACLTDKDRVRAVFEQRLRNQSFRVDQLLQEFEQKRDELGY